MIGIPGNEHFKDPEKKNQEKNTADLPQVKKTDSRTGSIITKLSLFFLPVRFWTLFLYD